MIEKIVAYRSSDGQVVGTIEQVQHHELALIQSGGDAVAELYDEHEQEIESIRKRSEGQSITVTFGNVIDCSESQPVVTTKIRFCETYTDERTNKISKDEKNQLKFETVEHAGRGGRKTEPDPEENGEPAAA